MEAGGRGWGWQHCSGAGVGYAIGAQQALGFGVTLLAGAAIVYSFWLILATLSFWFVRVENILIIFQGVYEAGRWPVGMYPRWLQVALTALVPVAFAVTVPAEAVVGRLTGPMLALALGLAAGLLVGARLFWNCGVKRYSGLLQGRTVMRQISPAPTPGQVCRWIIPLPCRSWSSSVSL